jgi:DNA polymerase
MIASCDYETYSNLDVTVVGAPRYARDPSTGVLMMSWAFNDDPVQIWVPDGHWDYDSFPRALKRHILRGGLLCAHNIEFEKNIFEHVLGIPTQWRQWIDTAVMALTRGYPMSLAGASAAVGMEEGKDPRGKQLIRKFSVRRKPTKVNPRDWWYPEDLPEEWQEFINYCKRDTEVERRLFDKFGGIKAWLPD